MKEDVWTFNELRKMFPAEQVQFSALSVNEQLVTTEA